MDTEVKKYNYAADAVKRSDELKQEAIEHKKLTEENNDLSKYFRMIQSGMYSKSGLKRFLSLTPGKYVSSDTGNTVLKAEQLSYLEKIKEMVQSQMDNLDGYDIDTRYEDIKNNYGEPISKEKYKLALSVQKELDDDSVPFKDILLAVDEGNITQIQPKG